MGLPILSITVERENDIVLARQRARQVAALLGIDTQSQTRFATAVSEIVRNAISYGGGGKIEFVLEGNTAPQLLLARISDQGPGIADLAELLNGQRQSAQGMGQGMGLINARRLTDQFNIASEPGKGTAVEMRQLLPKSAPTITANRLARIAQELEQQWLSDPFEEIQRQNRELMRTLEELRRRQEDLVRLNKELEDTNRGVVALYAELDEKAEQLSGANEMKTRFLSYLSHEFRTPLNSILALARLLLDRSDGDLAPEQEKQVTFISRSASELTDMVNDLLDLSKIEAGKIEIYPSEFEVANLFSALRGMLRPMLAGEQVNLIFEEPSELPPLYTDEGKVAQILRNFLSNALKFTERGEVRVSAQLATNRRAVIFSVADTGIGVAPEDQERIFEEFTQVKHSLQKKVKGTGLGLPLCRKLAELLGGSVEVKSQPGVGSTFSTSIPLTYSQKGPIAEKILLIDDEEAARYVLKKFLKNICPTVLEASDGATGLSLARAEQPQLIFLDLVMPGMTGTEVLAQLKADEQTRDIPVLIITSKALSRGERDHLTTYAEAIIPKAELGPDKLAAALKQVFGADVLSAT